MKPELSTFKSLPIPDLLSRYLTGTETINPKVLSLTDSQLDKTFTPEADTGLWSCRVLLGHLIDADLIFAHRLRRIAAENKPELPGWGITEFIENGLYNQMPPSNVLETMKSLRNWTGTWLKTLKDSDFERTGIHPHRGEVSLRAFLALATWHVDHHCWHLDKKIASFE